MGSLADLVMHEGAKGHVGGYWEHAGVLEMDRQILAYNRADWHVIPTSLPLQLDGELREQMRCLAEMLPDGFCCKEPRLVWTADLWSEWFRDITLIAVFRNPAGFRRSVAYVAAQDRFPSNGDLEDCLELTIWEAANRRLLELARCFPCHWICFDDPIPVLKNRLVHVIRQLGRVFDPAAFDAFFVPEERRFSSAADIDDSIRRLPSPIAALYQELRALAV